MKKCKHDDPTVQRDRTILLLLARLGLRAAEIVRMTLDDVDWEAGELTIHGKGGHRTNYRSRKMWASPSQNI